MTRRIHSLLVILTAFSALTAFAGETKTDTDKEKKIEVRRLEEPKPTPRRILRFERMGNLEDRSH